MRIAIIDLGTNSVRFDVHQLGPGKKQTTLHREKLMVRLGQDVFLNGELDKNAIRRTTHAFSNFKRISQSLHTHKIIAIGTSALREAHDGIKFVKAVEKATGIEIRIISGIEEARLIALGILYNEKLHKEKFGLIDIGGGSTEVCICQRRDVLLCESFALGTARLQQVFLKRSPPKKESIDQLRRYIQSVTIPKFYAQKWPKVDTLIGSSGTVRALAKILRKTNHLKHIEIKALSELVQTMSQMNTTQLLGLPGIEPKRVDMILSGAILLEECMIGIGAKKVIPTEHSLRDGILQEQMILYSKHSTTNISTHLEEYYQKAVQFGANEKNLRKLVEAGSLLFDRLKNLHKMKSEWKSYLLAALILRNTGEAISFTSHEEHSYYIVKHANFPSMQNWEAEFVAQLCKFHENTKWDQSEIPYTNEKAKRSAFIKLLSLLYLIDGLDADPLHTSIAIQKINLNQTSVRIQFTAGASSDLSLLRVDRKKKLFEDLFSRKIILN